MLCLSVETAMNEQRMFDAIVTHKLCCGIVCIRFSWTNWIYSELFKKACKWHWSNEKYNVCDLFKTRDQLFQATDKSSHYLLTPARNIQ